MTAVARTELAAEEPRDADRWLYVHGDELIGASSSTAVDLVQEAGLISQIAFYPDVDPLPSFLNPERIRLLIGGDGRVRAADWG